MPSGTGSRPEMAFGQVHRSQALKQCRVEAIAEREGDKGVRVHMVSQADGSTRLYPASLPQGCDRRPGDRRLQPVAQPQSHRPGRALYVSYRRAGDPP